MGRDNQEDARRTAGTTKDWTLEFVLGLVREPLTAIPHKRGDGFATQG